MAEKNITINVKTTDGYDNLYPETYADIVNYDETKTVKDKIEEIDNNKADKTYVDTQVETKGNCDIILAENKYIYISNWYSLTNTYLTTDDYNAMVDDGVTKYADIAVSGITDEYFATVAPEEKQKYNMVSANVTHSGYVRVYVKETPTSTVTINSIIAIKGV